MEACSPLHLECEDGPSLAHTAGYSGSSPLNENQSSASSPLSEDFNDYEFECETEDKIIKIKPTASQWEDFPAILSFARKLGAHNDGCFKLVLPENLRQPIANRPPRNLPANAYELAKKRHSWSLHAVARSSRFCSEPDPYANLELPAASAVSAVKALGKIFKENENHKGRQRRRKRRVIPRVRYRSDVPAWTPGQRLNAGVPTWSPIHPLQGDRLDRTKTTVPGIHTPYVYESATHFGAAFQMHVEDYRLLSLNHLYKGRKVWIVVPCTAIAKAEEALGRKHGCSQFMRHRAEFLLPEQLEKLGIPHRIVDQWPGETMVILPDAYHEGFSTGYTLAEAKNYADESWSTETYQPCRETCRLATAIPAELMLETQDNEEMIDLCVRLE